MSTSQQTEASTLVPAGTYRFNYMTAESSNCAMSLDVLSVEGKPNVGVVVYCGPPNMAPNLSTIPVGSQYMKGDNLRSLNEMVDMVTGFMLKVQPKVRYNVGMIEDIEDLVKELNSRKCVSCKKPFNGLCGPCERGIEDSAGEHLTSKCASCKKPFNGLCGTCWRSRLCSTCNRYPCECGKSNEHEVGELPETSFVNQELDSTAEEEVEEDGADEEDGVDEEPSAASTPKKRKCASEDCQFCPKTA